MLMESLDVTAGEGGGETRRSLCRRFKLYILINLGPLHKYRIKEGSDKSWDMKSNKKPSRHNRRLTMENVRLPWEAYSVADMVSCSNSDLC